MLHRPMNVFVLSTLLVFFAAFMGCTRDVLTQHNNISRTGEYLEETNLTPGNVRLGAAPGFGVLYTRDVEGGIYSQPLYVHGVSTPSGNKNLFFIATETNMVYAFDADDRSGSSEAVFSKRLQPTGPTTICTETPSGVVGITGTPVIDSASHAIYVVARNALDHQYYLHKLDISNGFNDLHSPVLISATDVNGVQFNAECERNRPGLLLLNGVVYVGFGTFNCDQPCPGGVPYHGWVLGYRTTDLALVSVFCTSPQGSQAGIWQTGGGLASDGTYIYFETGNGPPPLGDSFVQLQVTNSWPGLTRSGSYTPTNAPTLNTGDTDLGSGGPVILPGGRLVGGGKQGRYYVVSTTGMTLAQDPAPTPPGGFDGFQAFNNTYHSDPSHPACAPAGGAAGCNVSTVSGCYIDVSRYGNGELCGPNIHSTPVFWSLAGSGYGMIYQMSEKDFLKAFRYDYSTHHLQEGPAATSGVRPVDGMPGGFSSLSSDGDSNGIIWTSLPLGDAQWMNVPGRIVALDASNLQELWHDDGGLLFAKSVPPTIAEGKVIRATASGLVVVYGLRRPSWWYTLTHYLFKPNRPPYPEPDGSRAIERAFRRYGGATGVLGSPEAGVVAVNDTVGGWFQDFRGALVLTHHATVSVHPKVLTEQPTCSRPPGPDSRTIVESSVYWHPKYGTHVVTGEIRQFWLKLGGPRGALGYPTSDELPTGDGEGRLSSFEHGDIVWYPDKGASMRVAELHPSNTEIFPKPGDQSAHARPSFE